MNKARVHGHFGEFLQGLIGDEVALISCPCQELWAEANAVDRASDPVRDKVLSAPELKALLAPLGIDDFRFQLRANMPRGGGGGLSTASRLAVLELLFPDMVASEKAAHLLVSEGAVDPLMYDDFEGYLWASRRAKILAATPDLPKMRIIGGFWGEGEFTDPRDTKFAKVEDLILAWTQAQALCDFATLASTSAQRNFQIRGKKGEIIEKLAEDLGALGFLAAHTGSARGLIFPADYSSDEAEKTLKMRGFKQIVKFEVGRL